MKHPHHLFALFVSLVSVPNESLAQQGPTSRSCAAYMNSQVVARYNCLAGKDADGRINFIQWSEGTASTGLGGWKRSGNSCFAASEQPQWKICAE